MGTPKKISHYLRGFTHTGYGSLPHKAGVFVVSCEIADVHSLLHAEFAEDIAAAVAVAIKRRALHQACSGTIHYQIWLTTDKTVVLARVQALLRFCRHDK